MRYSNFARSFAFAFLATGAMVQAAAPVTAPGNPGNPLMVSGKLSAKGSKPIQSITVRIMPTEVFAGETGSVYVSSKSETSCVAWVDQAAVAGKKRTGSPDILRAAFEECGKTFE